MTGKNDGRDIYRDCFVVPILSGLAMTAKARDKGEGLPKVTPGPGQTGKI